MTRIVRLMPVESIKVGPGSTILPDGTIDNPEPYHGCLVELDDGVQVQVERPLTLAAIRIAYEIAVTNPVQEVDGVNEGDELPPGP